MISRFFAAVVGLGVVVSAITINLPLSMSNAAPVAQATANKNWRTAKLIQTIPTAANRMILSPDGKTIAVQTQTSSGEAIVELWNINTGKAIYRFAGFSDRGYDDEIAFSPDGKILAVSNYFPAQKTLLIKLWDVQSKQEVRTLKSTDSISSEGSTIVFSPDGKTIASIAGNSLTIQLWDVQRGVVRARLTGANGRTLAFSPDGQRLASSNRQARCFADTARVALWNVSTRKQLHTLRGNQPIGNLVFSRDSKTLINTYESMVKGIQRWNVETGKPIRTRNYEFHWSENPVFSPDGQYVASGSSYAPLRIYDLGLDKPVFETQEFLVAGGAITFSPDGQTLAGITDGTKIKIWR
ncbi:WD40 repeat domain-containing protein [Phormidesmis sp. 146-12]